MLAKQKLERVRRRARRLLLLRRAGQAVAGAAGVAVGLGLLDWGLRLPGWLRLGLGLVVLAAGCVWLATRLGRAWLFGPGLPELALRAEARFPTLRGVLASGLELAGSGGALGEAAAREAEAAAADTPLGELVEPRPARRAAGAGLTAAAGVALLTALLPATAATAAQRWLNPLGGVEWPRRYAVRVEPLPAVLPAGTPIAVRASVEGPGVGPGLGLGPNRGLRAWATVAFLDAASGRRIATEEVLMTADETGGSFAARVPVPTAAAAAVDTGVGVRAEARVEAGDAASEVQDRPVRRRPGLASASARVEPPAYAARLVEPSETRLAPGGDTLGRVAALAGSRVELTLGFNRPLPADTLAGGGFAEGFPPLEIGTAADPAEGLTAAFVLGEDAAASIRLADGPAGDPATLRDAAPRRLDLVATPDEAPRARVAEPAADFAVLATAVLPVAAAGSDDLTLTALSLEAAVRRGDAESVDAETLAEAGAVGRELEARGSLDVAVTGAGPGDAVVLNAVARAPGLNGPVETRSAPRVLRVVEASELLGEIRREVAAVRREARGLAAEQGRLREADTARPEAAAAAAARQARLARAAEAAGRRLAAVAERLAVNRSGEEELEAAIDAAGERLASAVSEAEAAETGLTAGAAVENEQGAAEEDLTAAADLLDAGGDAAALRLDARALAEAQAGLRAEAARLLPLTAGRTPEQLDAPLREQVEALAREQAALTERAAELVEKLRAAAEDPGSTDAERAAAAAAAQAARAAAEAGLTAEMTAAAEEAGENRMAGAGERQEAALAALDGVLEAFEGQAERRRELLKARLAELIDRVRRVRTDTAAAEATLAAAIGDAAVVSLAEPLSALWERSLAAAGAAAEEEATASAAPPLEAAAAAKLRGVAALREASAVPARAAERQALASLDEAIAELERLEEEQAAEDEAEKNAKMRALYAALADRQDALAAEVEPLAGDAPGRRARATLRGLARPQEEIAGEASALEERAGAGAVFAAVHAEVDAAMKRSAVRLRTGEALAAVPADQRSAAASLRAMAEALVPPPPGNDFDENGGGGGGGGAGAAPPDVPPAAQVKLLRGMQARLLAESDRLRGEAAGAEPVDAEAGTRLAERQRTLLALGRALAEQVEQASEPPTPPAPGDAAP